jgi:hypothetical protein
MNVTHRSSLNYKSKDYSFTYLFTQQVPGHYLHENYVWLLIIPDFDKHRVWAAFPNTILKADQKELESVIKKEVIDLIEA